MKKHHKAFFWLMIIASGLLTACTSRNGPPASVEYDKVISPYHIVRKGDSIASIAQKYNMDKHELIKINGLESPYRIVRGQRLLVRPHDNSKKRGKSATVDPEEAEDETDEDGVDIKPLNPLGTTMTGLGAAGAGAAAGADIAGSSLEGNGEFGEEEGPGIADGQQDSRAASMPAVDQRRELPPPPAAANNYTWPTQGKVVREFNPAAKDKTKNLGINIAAPRGTPVVAANNGVVAHSGNQLRGFGNVVLVKHENGTMTVYAHLDKVAVKNGDIVRSGQKLGTVGQSGAVNQPQLHFEIRQGSKPIDPGQYLR